MQSRSIGDNWGATQWSPNANDALLQTIVIGKAMTHAGGFQVIGDYAAIPLEENGASRIVFFDLSDPGKPRRLPAKTEITRPSLPAGAVAIAKLKTGKFLLLVGRTDSNILDFYRSETTSLENPKWEYLDNWREDELTGLDREFGNYQNINFVMQSDGAIYFIGLHRNTKVVVVGDDWIDLFRLTFNDKNQAAIRKVGQRHMHAQAKANFDGGAGIFCTGPDVLVGYGARMWPNRPTNFIFEEFRAIGTAQPGAVLFDDVGFKDRSIAIFASHPTGWMYTDYDKVQRFEDKTSSIKWVIPADQELLLFEDKNFKGAMLRLVGTGATANLGMKGWGDKISSSRFAPNSLGTTANGWIELFDDTNFKDRRLTITAGNGSVKNYKKINVEGGGGFGDKPSSARWLLPKGVRYRLYEHDGYRGRTFDLVGTGRVEELSSLAGFGDTTSSSRFP